MYIYVYLHMFILAQNRDWKRIREDVNNGSMEIVNSCFFLTFFFNLQRTKLLLLYKNKV